MTRRDPPAERRRYHENAKCSCGHLLGAHRTWELNAPCRLCDCSVFATTRDIEELGREEATHES